MNCGFSGNKATSIVKRFRMGMEKPETLCASKYFSGIEEIIVLGILQLSYTTRFSF